MVAVLFLFTQNPTTVAASMVLPLVEALIAMVQLLHRLTLMTTGTMGTHRLTILLTTHRPSRRTHRPMVRRTMATRLEVTTIPTRPIPITVTTIEGEEDTIMIMPTR